MEQPPGKPLSYAEKEKLKEKLAYLKKEYSKTLARLQRAKRAEKVQSSKKTIEQDGLLQQELSPQLNLDSEPVNENFVCDKFQINHLDEETGEKTSETLSVEPEAFSPKDGREEVSYTQRTGDIQARFLHSIRGPDGEKGQSELPRGIKKPKKIVFSQEKESFFDTNSLIFSGKYLKTQKTIRGSPRSPVTEITHILSINSQTSGLLPQGTETDGGALISPSAKSERGVKTPLRGNSASRETTVPLCTISSSNSEHLEHTPPNNECKLLSQRLKNISPASSINLEAQDRKMTLYTNNPVVNKAQCASGQLSDSPNSEAGDSCSVSKLTHSNLLANITPHLAEQSHIDNSLKSSNILDGRNKNHKEDEVLCGSKSASPGAVSSLSAEKQIHSCTMLEGLLFPAEYYIRTTRRMSDCQRKIALEAVIQSHLGIKKKGLKHKNKEATKSLNLSSEETDQSESSILDTCTRKSSSGRPPQELLSSAEISFPTGPTEASNCSRKASIQPSGRRHRRKRRLVHTSIQDHHKLFFPPCSILSLNRSKDKFTMYKCQDGKAVIHDFQLPDEDFGPLKLEKLKSCSEKLIEVPESKKHGERLPKEGNGTVLEEPVPKQIEPEVEDLEEELGVLSGKAHPSVPRLENQPVGKGLSSSVVLFTPSDTAVPDDSDRPAELCSPTFPILGTTPAFGSPPYCEKVSTEVGQTWSTPQPPYLGDIVSFANNSKQFNSSARSPKLDSSLHVSD